MYKLVVQDLHKRYGSHEVLKGVSLAAAAGDVISIIGSSRMMQRKKVLLPEPLEPMMLITSPAAAARDTPLSTS